MNEVRISISVIGIASLILLGCSQAPKKNQILQNHSEKTSERKLSSQEHVEFTLQADVAVQQDLNKYAWGQIAVNETGNVLVIIKDVKKAWLLHPDSLILSKPFDLTSQNLLNQVDVEIEPSFVSGYGKGFLLQGSLTTGSAKSILLTKVRANADQSALFLDRLWGHLGVSQTNYSKLEASDVNRMWFEQMVVSNAVPTPSYGNIHVVGTWDQKQKIGSAEVVVRSMAEVLSPGSGGGYASDHRTHYVANFDEKGEHLNTTSLHMYQISDFMMREGQLWLWQVQKKGSSKIELDLFSYDLLKKEKTNVKKFELDTLINDEGMAGLSERGLSIRWVGQDENNIYAYIRILQSEISAQYFMKINSKSGSLRWLYPVDLSDQISIMDIVYHPQKKVFYVLGLNKKVVTESKTVLGIIPAGTEDKEVFDALIYEYPLPESAL